MKILPISLSSTEVRATFIGLAFLSFAVPFSLGHPQLLVGTLVNGALFCSAVLLPSKFFLPLVFFPSLAVLSRGLLFGPLTVFLAYMLPFIWLANLILVLVFKKAFTRLNFFFSVIIAALAKQALLFSIANLFVGVDLAPKIFLKTMGINQMITACLGGLLAFLVLKRFFVNDSSLERNP